MTREPAIIEKAILRLIARYPPIIEPLRSPPRPETPTGNR